MANDEALTRWILADRQWQRSGRASRFVRRQIDQVSHMVSGTMWDTPTNETLREWVVNAHGRSFALIEDLSDAQCMVPRSPILTPFVWELAHTAWFSEHWVLRHARRQPAMYDNGDATYNSAQVPHPTRWDMNQLPRAEVHDYCNRVRDGVLAVLDSDLSETDRYFVQLAVFHEDMHAEAFTYMRQTIGLPPPAFCAKIAVCGAACDGDVRIDGSTFVLGGTPDMPFVFDNEKWGHEVEIAPFSIARACVTQQDFADFIDAGGYGDDRLWSDAGRAWRDESGAEHPIYWRRADGGWQRRDFAEWVELEARLPVHHVSWFEAEAFCRWADRRLPTEAEWELAAGGVDKQRFPWGNDTRACANLDWRDAGVTDVAAFEDSDSAQGCRQMIGNVWEWTATTFEPFPGFVKDPYEDYSAPFFGTRKVLRGGSWASTARMLRATWRNFFEPLRNDVIVGFRTCAR